MKCPRLIILQDSDLTLQANIPTNMASDSEDEEEEDMAFDAVGTSHMNDPAEMQYDLEPVVDDDCWKPTDGYLGDASLTGLRGPVGSRSHYKQDTPPSFPQTRRNGALHDDVKQNLIIGGIIPSGSQQHEVRFLVELFFELPLPGQSVSLCLSACLYFQFVCLPSCMSVCLSVFSFCLPP